MFFLGAWFLYQLVEANFGIFAAGANGGGVAFFAHVGGFIFGVAVTTILVNSGRIAEATAASKPPSPPRRSRTKLAFQRSAQVDADHIIVQRNGGTVIAAAWAAPGVLQVENEIVVEP